MIQTRKRSGLSFVRTKYIIRTLALLPLLALAPFSHAADVDKTPSFSGNTFGVYIWRTGTGEWQIRSTGGASFDGTFETEGSISNVNKLALEGADSVFPQNSASELKVKFNSSKGDIDGARFSSSGKDLCLKSNGANVTVRLGQNEVLAQTPVDLTGTGSCYVPPPAPDEMKGMVLTDKGNNVWQVRLISTDQTESFKGTAVSTANIRWFNKYQLEASDVVKKPNSKTIEMNLSSWPGGIDGTNIAIASGSGLCLTATGGDYSQIVVIDKNGAATLRSSPVDVTDNGACGGNSGGDAGGGSGGGSTPPVSGGRRYNAGHYVAVMRGNDSQKTMASVISPGVVGLQKRYTWRSLEPTQGNYNFSEIASDLAFAASQGMQFVVMIEDKTFVNENPMPGYLNSLALPNRSGGKTGARWKGQYVTRFNALTKALGNRFNSNPNFEGIAIQESALGLEGNILDANGYSANAYANALINIINTGSSNIPKARFFWYMNFFPRGLDKMEDITVAVRASGAIVGGPDILVDEESLQKHAYPIYRKYADKQPFFGQIEPMCYFDLRENRNTGAKTKYWTMPELFRYGRDNLKVDYIFWVNYKKPRGADWYDFTQAKPVINNNPGYNK